MTDLLELSVSAAAAGSIYALIALAYLLILRPTGIINFAVGEWAMIGGFMAVAALTELLAESFSVPYLPGVVLVLVAMAVVGWLVEWFTVRPLVERGASVLSPILALLGILIIFQELGAIFGGTEALRTDSPFGFLGEGPPGAKRLAIGSVAGSPQEFYTIGATLIVFLAIWLFFERTIWGKAFEAVALDRRAAALMGINLRNVAAMSFAAAAVVAAFAGVLVSGNDGAYFRMGLPLAVQGFTALVIGGIGRVEGALLGGLLLGFTEALATRYLPIPSGLVLGVPLVLLIMFLLVRPTGILKEKAAR